MLRTLLVGIALLAIPASAQAAPTKANWDKREQKQVVSAGLMSNQPDGFRGDQPLSAADLTQAFTALSATTGTPAVTVSSAPISVTRFDTLVVDQLGLSDAAQLFQDGAKNAGLRPPSYFGTEVTARLLGLRYNHQSPYDDLELYPSDRITRAEAAYSLAQVLHLDSREADYARATAARFQLPSYTPKQRGVLTLAVSKIGMPYVWGGETDGPSPGQVHGGYDCSGFAWRVFKLSGNPAGRQIGGRTAAQQAGEIPKSRRIALADAQPGDLLFFGTAHFRSRATESNVTHEGIALSADWAINSSSQGVYVLPLDDGWLHDSFTWARRIL
jgi:cell wall-associated NlpC family hydrolase